MTAAAASSDLEVPNLQTEVTPIGVQSLMVGVAPITPAQRLAFRAEAPLSPKKPQRPANHGLFGTNARKQIEMF